MKTMKLTLVMLLLLPIFSMAQHFGGVGRGDYSLSYTDPVVVTATLGTAGPTVYLTLKTAFDAINLGTHQGVITVKINASITEIASAVLNASGSGTLPNQSSYTAINIYPTATGLTISGNLAAPLIDLNGADNVTIDGRVNATGSVKSLTIANTSALATVGTSTIRFINSAESNTVKYCTIKGSSTDGSAGVLFFSTSTETFGNDGNTIDNNNITNSADVSRPVNAVYSEGTSGKENNNNTISNNNIYDYFKAVAIGYNHYTTGVYISGNSTAWSVTGNSFYETTSIVLAGDVNYYGILISNSTGNNFIISDNIIGGNASGNTGTMTISSSTNRIFTGIYLLVGTSVASSVQNNTIKNIAYTCN
ncbi:MAG: hypothetical protein WCP32_17250 [Bacteroidota bacterium]